MGSGTPAKRSGARSRADVMKPSGAGRLPRAILWSPVSTNSMPDARSARATARSEA
jgi:hypothetical protein